MVKAESSNYQIVGINTWLVTGVAGFIGSNILETFDRRSAGRWFG